jgi:hypothetical protein
MNITVANPGQAQPRANQLDVRWDQNLQLLVEFFERENSYPKSRAKNGSEEKRLYTWQKTRRNEARGKGGGVDKFKRLGREAILDAKLPRWKVGVNDKWFESLDALVAFRHTNNHLPRKSAPAGSEEFVLYNWLHSRRGEANGVKADKYERLGREAILDAKLPNWQANIDGKWLENLDAIVALYSTEGRLPRSNSPTGSEEFSLYKWLSKRRGEADGKGVGVNKFKRLGREAILDAKLPNWKAGVDARWLRLFDELVEFRATENRMPNQGAAAGPEERALYRWLALRRVEANGKGGGAPKFERLGRGALIDAALPGWRITRQSNGGDSA